VEISTGNFLELSPNEQSCLRPVRALAVEMHESWIEAYRYIDMNLLKERRTQGLIQLAVGGIEPGGFRRAHAEGPFSAASEAIHELHAMERCRT
jgi:hypothetical protein